MSDGQQSDPAEGTPQDAITRLASLNGPTAEIEDVIAEVDAGILRASS
jgi:hypothetical protein